MPIPIFSLVTIGLLPSSIKKQYYRWRGAKIGKGVSLGLFSVLSAKEIDIDDHSSVGMFTFLTARKIKLGKRVSIKMMTAIETGDLVIDNDTIIMEQVIVGGMMTPRSSLTIGKRVKVFPHSFLNTTEPITIHDDVGVGGSNYLFTHATWQNVLDGFPATFGPITIERNVWLPWRVFIMPNVTIGEDSIVGADSTVTRNIPPKSIASGSPAEIKLTDGKFIRKMNDKARNKYVLRILNEMVEYFNYCGMSTSISHNTESSLTISIQTTKGVKSLYYSDDLHDEVHADYMIFLNSLDAAQESTLTQKSVGWFDLSSKRSFYRYDDPTWGMIKDYFSRYGIRFEFIN